MELRIGFEQQIQVKAKFIEYKYENKKTSEQAHIPLAPTTLLENAVYNEWKFQALVTGNRTKKGI